MEGRGGKEEGFMAEGVFCADLMEWYRSNYRKGKYQRTDKKEEGEEEEERKKGVELTMDSASWMARSLPGERSSVIAARNHNSSTPLPDT